PPLSPRDVLTFADLDNDGQADAIVGRYLDYLQDAFTPPAHPPFRSSWFRGRGDGTFEPPRHLEDASAATTAAIAVGDVNRDGLPDLWLGNWYEKYFSGYAAFANDLLLQYPRFDDNLGFVRWPIPDESLPAEPSTDL